MARRLLRATLLAPVTGTPLHPPKSTTVFSDLLPVGAGLEARLDVVGGIPTPWTRLYFIQMAFQS
jgi:hypothetical protein